jgi:hypothetical protein
VPKGEPQLELRIHYLKLNLLVLEIITRHEGLFDKILNDLTFRYYFQRTVLNAEYYKEFIIYIIRRTIANKINSKVF